MMNFKRIIEITIPACLLVATSSPSGAIAFFPSIDSSEKSTTLIAQEPVALMTGTFVAAEQPTAGTARIVTENGQRYLELDAGFSTSEQGPDLHVLLDTVSTPPQQYENTEGRYVNLGALQEYSGAQRYPIPDVVDSSAFSSVVIWCRMANATFGYASLEQSSVGLK